jgi:hypothetical protein
MGIIAEINFTQIAEAREYRETMTMIDRLKNILETTKTETKFPANFDEIGQDVD